MKKTGNNFFFIYKFEKKEKKKFKEYFTEEKITNIFRKKKSKIHDVENETVVNQSRVFSTFSTNHIANTEKYRSHISVTTATDCL